MTGVIGLWWAPGQSPAYLISNPLALGNTWPPLPGLPLGVERRHPGTLPVAGPAGSSPCGLTAASIPTPWPPSAAAGRALLHHHPPAQKPAQSHRGHTRSCLDADSLLDGRRRRCGRNHLHPLRQRRLAGGTGDGPQPGSLDSPHRPGLADRDHQTLRGRTAHPLRTPVDPASSQALAVGGEGHSRPARLRAIPLPT